MLVYDITNPKSFENIEKWLKNVKDHASSDVEIALLANKRDEEGKRLISTNQGVELAQKYGMQYFEISAKTNSENNIDNAFKSLASAVIEKMAKKAALNTNNHGVQVSDRDKTLKKSNCC